MTEQHLEILHQKTLEKVNLFLSFEIKSLLTVHL